MTENHHSQSIDNNHNSTASSFHCTQPGGHRGKGGLPPNLENYPKNLVQNCKFVPQTPILGKLSGKIKILSIHNLLCQKFPAVSWKNGNSCPHLLFETTTPLGTATVKVNAQHQSERKKQ